MSRNEPAPDCELRLDAAPYVLGALEDAHAYRVHLAACPTCQAEVAELQPLVDLLPASVAPAVASDELRARVLATVRAEAELFQAAGSQADEVKAPGRLSSRRLPFALAAGALGAAATVAVAIALSTGPAHERVIAASVAATEPGARAALHELAGRAELVVNGMRQPPLGKIYEVWLRRPSGPPQPTDVLFSVTSRGRGSVDVPASLHGVKEVLVTSEPLGGSSHPTSSPVIRVSLAT